MPAPIDLSQKTYFDYINKFLSISDLDELLEKICKETPKIINGEDCSIFLLPDLVKEYNGNLVKKDGTTVSQIDDRFIVLARTTREDFKEKVGKAFYSECFGLTGWIFGNGEPLQLDDMQDENELREKGKNGKICKQLVWENAYKGADHHYPDEGRKPFIGVPLIKGDKVLGVIRLSEITNGNSFPEYALDVLKSFGGILANLIENVDSKKNLENSLTGLIEIGATRNKKDVFNSIVKEASSLVRSENCELYTLNKYGEEIILQSSTGKYMEDRRKKKIASSYKRGYGLTGWIFKTGKPLCIGNLHEFKEEKTLTPDELDKFSDGQIIEESDKKIKWSDSDNQFEKDHPEYPYFLGVPIRSETEEVIGVLRVSSHKSMRLFDKNDMDLLGRFAKNIALILRNQSQDLLSNVLIEIGKSYSKDELFKYVVKEIPELVLGRGCSVFLKRPNAEIIELAYSSSDILKDSKGNLISLAYNYGEGKTGFTAEIGRILVIIYYGKGEIKKTKIKYDFENYNKDKKNLCRYLIDDEGNIVGIIRVIKDENERDFTDEDRNKFDSFCTKNPYREGGLTSHKHALCETGIGGYSQSYLAVPIKLKSGELVGVIRIPRKSEAIKFSDRDLELVQSITGRLTSALEIERAMTTIRENLQTLSFINSKINSPFDKDNILDEILEALTEKLGYEFATIQLVNSEKNTIETIKGRKNSAIEDAVDPNQWRGLSHSLDVTQNPIDIQTDILMVKKEAEVIKGWDERFDKVVYDKYNHKDLVRAFVPIIAYEPKTDKPIKIGTLEAGHNIYRKDHIGEQELEMLKAVANQVAITIRNREQIWSQFLLTVSHQLRNLLTPIKSSVQLVINGTDGEINDEQELRLEMALETISEQERLVTNLLDIVRIVKERVSFEGSNQNLSSIINDVVKIFENEAKNKNICLNCSLSDVLNVWIDERKIKQVLTNLLENAIKFSSNNGHINVSMSDDNDNIKIEISDTGKGIDDKNKERIFEEFFQCDYTCDGVGIGLSIVKKYVELHRGKIIVKDNEGGGSIFIITIPKRREANE